MHSPKVSFPLFWILAPSFPFPGGEPRIRQEAGYPNVTDPLFFLLQPSNLTINFYASLCENNSASISYFYLISDSDYFMK